MAGIVLGSVRPSMDIDFEIEFESPEKIDEAIRAVSARLNLPAQYSENIQGWSQISYLNYRESSLLYKKFGKIEVRVMAPENWTIGKMTRYLPLDIMDISFVLKKRSIDWKPLVNIWARALKQSPLSDRSREFKDHVMDFLGKEGKKIWGKAFQPEKAVDEFDDLFRRTRK